MSAPAWHRRTGGSIGSGAMKSGGWRGLDIPHPASPCWRPFLQGGLKTSGMDSNGWVCWSWWHAVLSPLKGSARHSANKRACRNKIEYLSLFWRNLSWVKKGSLSSGHLRGSWEYPWRHSHFFQCRDIPWLLYFRQLFGPPWREVWSLFINTFKEKMW